MKAATSDVSVSSAELEIADENKQKFEKMMSARFPLLPWIVFFVMELALVAVVLTKYFFGSLDDCKSWPYWTLIAGQSSLSIVLFVVTIVYANWLYRKRSETDFIFKGDVRYNPVMSVLLLFGSFVAGVAAGFIGIGGGIINGPIMLQLGLVPQVATATSSFMVLFTSSSTTLQYVLLGTAPVFENLFCFVVSFVGAVIGQNVIKIVIAKTGRQSFINFFLSFFIILSAIFLVALDVYEVVHQLLDHDYMGFSSLR